MRVDFKIQIDWRAMPGFSGHVLTSCILALQCKRLRFTWTMYDQIPCQVCPKRWECKQGCLAVQCFGQVGTGSVAYGSTHGTWKPTAPKNWDWKSGNCSLAFPTRVVNGQDTQQDLLRFRNQLSLWIMVLSMDCQRILKHNTNAYKVSKSLMIPSAVRWIPVSWG